jgi:hypothetical protein
MTVSMFLSRLAEIPRLRAMRLLDAANAAHPTTAWIDRLFEDIDQDAPPEREAPRNQAERPARARHARSVVLTA